MVHCSRVGLEKVPKKHDLIYLSKIGIAYLRMVGYAQQGLNFIQYSI